MTIRSIKDLENHVPSMRFTVETRHSHYKVRTMLRWCERYLQVETFIYDVTKKCDSRAYKIARKLGDPSSRHVTRKNLPCAKGPLNKKLHIFYLLMTGPDICPSEFRENGLLRGPISPYQLHHSVVSIYQLILSLWHNNSLHDSCLPSFSGS